MELTKEVLPPRGTAFDDADSVVEHRLTRAVVPLVTPDYSGAVIERMKETWSSRCDARFVVEQKLTKEVMSARPAPGADLCGAIERYECARSRFIRLVWVSMFVMALLYGAVSCLERAS